MNWNRQDYITMRDIGTAYRKAKADLFYERGHPNNIALCRYEENLEENLASLYQKLVGNSLQWMTGSEFVGTWSVMPKGIEELGSCEEDIPWRPSDPEKAWLARVEAMSKKPKAEFRMIGIHSVEFHIVSTLWVLKVGHLYDGVLGREAYGSRLRRVYRKEEDEIGDINTLSLGTFRPYLQPFRQWRDSGLKAMRYALNDGKRVIGITADVRQFYYRTSPAFLLHEGYLQAVGLQNQLSEDQRRFTQALIDAIKAWASQTPIHSKQPSVGIPVGLPAARLIANVALAELDKAIRRELSPLYYGRYVDDILLVMEDKRGFENAQSVLDFVVKRLEPILQFEQSNQGISIGFQRDYLGDSSVVFTGEKQKVFLLEGVTGMSLIDSIDQEIRNRASEWRALPEMPENAEELGSGLISAFDEKGEEVDNLRKTDALSTRRATLSISLRKLEAFEHDLPPQSWLSHRKVFYKTFLNHFVTVPRVFDFPDALARVFGLAIACGDYDEATLLVERLARVVTTVKRKCKITLASDDMQKIKDQNLLSKWRNQLAKALGEAAAAAVGANCGKDSYQMIQLAKVVMTMDLLGSSDKFTTEELAQLGSSLYFHDLGRVPFRERYLPYGREENNKQLPVMKQPSSFCGDTVLAGVGIILDFAEKDGFPQGSLPLALLFPTRPFSIPEFYLLAPQLLTDINEKEKISTLALCFRGFSPRRSLPGIERDRKGKAYIAVAWRNGGGNPDGEPAESNAYPEKKVRIAITSWQTNRSSWIASIVRNQDPDRGRYGRLNGLLNQIMESERLPDYVVLPELSVPARWFYRLAAKLATRGISLIAGVEYQHHGAANVANQVWASLVSDFLVPPQMIIYRQDKQRPAQGEEGELQSIGNVRLAPLTTIASEADRMPIWHGSFVFGILICSELTNVESRGVFRGRVDALFVPEWNQDTESFSALVEASALDLHAYIVQCNDRQYGDSRIRVPGKEFWQREIIRVKGGVQDYFVIGEIDVTGLRRFQSRYRSPEDGPFKPVPDGFEIDPRRRLLPD
jgi:hypothetical protein